MDNLTKEERSRQMAKVKSKDTKPEVYLRHLLWHQGFRYRKNDKRIPGSPDIYLPKYKVAIFVNGCFWHRHEGCPNTRTPKSNVEFWKKKFAKNVERDQRIKNELSELGVHQIVVWECQVKKMMKNKEEEQEDLDKIISEIKQFE